MSSAATLSTLEKIRLTIARRNPRVQDNFADFDRLRSGNVTKAQFRRCLTTAALTDGITERELMDLVESYESPSNPILASYARFLADVKGAEAPAEQLSPARGTVKRLSAEEEATLERSYEFFRQRIGATSLDIRAAFKDFDKFNNGSITAPQFERCFPFKVDPAVMAAIKRKYVANAAGDIAYNCWCADVLGEPLGDGTVRFRTGPAGGFGQSFGELRGADRLVEQIRVQLATNRLRCDDFLRDYDKLNTGIVTPAQFGAAMGRVQFVRFQLTAADLATLADAYAAEDKSGQRKVDYAAFLADVAPHVQPAGAAAPQSLNATFGTAQDAESERRCDAVIERIRSHIATHRMNLRPIFHDFDQANKGLYRTRTCTRGRFERALAISKVNVSPAEVALLVRRYATTSSNTGDDVNYNAFCDHVDLPLAEDAATNVNRSGLAAASYVAGGGGGAITRSAAAGAAALASSSSHSGGSPSSSPNSPSKVLGGSGRGGPVDTSEETIGAILDTIMRVVIARRVRLAEFIRDNDPLRSGVAPKDRFLSAILTSNVVLTASELNSLAAYYAHPTIGGYVDINRFLADIDTGARIVHPAEAPLDREIDVKNRTLESYADRKGAAVGGAAAPQLANVLKRIREDVRARGVLLPPFFKDYDLHRCGRITKAQFHQTLSRHKFPAAEGDIALLKAYYEDPTDPLMVKYRDFIGDVDASENVAAQLEIRQSVRKLPASPNATFTATNVPAAGASFGRRAVGTAAGGSPLSPSKFEGTFAANNSIADGVLQKIADFVLRRNVRIEEFCKDGDPLKKGFLSNSRFRHAIDILGVSLAEPEMVALEQAFSSAKAPDSVCYVDFLAAVKETKARAQLHSMSATRAEAAAARTEVEDRLLDRIVEKVQRAFGSRRIASRQVFQDYDRLHKGRVPEGHFFTALLSVGLNLTPTENSALKKAYAQGDGSMVYGEFSARVDAQLGLDN